VSDAGGIRDISKAAMAVVPIKGIPLIREISNHQIGQTVIVVVSEIHAHAGTAAPVIVDAHVRFEANFLEGPVTSLCLPEIRWNHPSASCVPRLPPVFLMKLVREKRRSKDANPQFLLTVYASLTFPS
jgi:hypothetical protein